VLHEVFELKGEITIFRSVSNNSDDANLRYNEDSAQQLSYLVGIIEKLSNLNESRQGPQINILNQDDKVNAFMKELEL
jgi:hypothetical protein